MIGEELWYDDGVGTGGEVRVGATAKLRPSSSTLKI